MKTHLSLFCLTTLLSAPLPAAEARKDASPVPSAEEQAKLMELWTKLNAKGEPHAQFQKSVGTWNTIEKHFMGAQPFEGKGTATLRTILDGRYLVQEYRSESPLGKFEGFGITAYDNLQKQYVMVWMDSLSTGISTSYGMKTGQTTTYHGKQEMPGGTTMHHRMVLEELGPDQMILTMDGRTAAETEFRKQMEITYTRVK